MTSACIQQIFSRPLAFGDIHKGNYGALNYIFQGAIGTDAHQVLRARYGLCLGVMRSQAIQHGLHVVNQTVVADQVGNDVSHRASDVGLDLVDQLGGGGVKRAMRSCRSTKMVPTPAPASRLFVF